MPQDNKRTKSYGYGKFDFFFQYTPEEAAELRKQQEIENAQRPSQKGSGRKMTLSEFFDTYTPEDVGYHSTQEKDSIANTLKQGADQPIPARLGFEDDGKAFLFTPLSPLVQDVDPYQFRDDKSQFRQADVVLPRELDSKEREQSVAQFLSLAEDAPRGLTSPKSDKKTAQEIRDIIEKGDLTIALEKGFYGGVTQTASLFTGIEAESEIPKNYDIDSDLIQHLQNFKYISPKEANKYREKRNALPFLTATVAALTTSVGLAVGIAATAPARAVLFTAQGIKWFSKEALKRWGKEVAIQGKNSWRILGPGANIRAVRETHKELSEKIDQGIQPDVWDYVGTALKNAFKENLMATAEGAFEGMIQVVRFHNVPFKALKQFDSKAWKDFGKNLLKKGTLGTGTETFTEQITDVTQDILEPGSRTSGYWIFAGENPEIRRHALENLAIEAIVGHVLGHTFGVRDLFIKPVEVALQEQIDKGVITKQQADDFIEWTSSPAAQKIVQDIFTKTNIKANEASHLKETRNAIKHYMSAGAKEDFNTTALLDLTADQHEQALEVVEQSYPELLVATMEAVKDIPNSNVLDVAAKLGKLTTERYVQAAMKVTGEEVSADIDQTLPDISNDILHKYTEKLLSFAAETSTQVSVTSDEVSDPKIRQKLQTDIQALKLAGLTDKSSNILFDKYQSVLSREVLEPILERNIKVAIPLETANKVQDMAFEAIRSDLVMQKTTENLQDDNDFTKDIMGDEISNIEDVSDPTYFRSEEEKEEEQHLNEEIIPVDFNVISQTLAKETGTTYEGIQAFPSGKSFYLFTDPETESTHAFAVGELNSQALNDRFVASREEFAKYQKETKEQETKEPIEETKKLFQERLYETEIEPRREELPQERTAITFQKIIKRSDLKENPDKIFVFGDNDQRVGLGGQAKEMRGEPNSIGIRTKKSPSMDESAFYNDNELEQNKTKINEDINRIKEQVELGKTIVFPLSGVGTGLSQLQTKAPQTFQYLTTQLKSLRMVATSPQVQQDPIVSPSKQAYGPKYKDFLANFQGKNFAELIKYLKENDLISEDLSALIDALKLVKHIGDYKISIEELDPKYPGRFIPRYMDETNSRIIINPNATLETDKYDVIKTALHEAIHALTVDFLESNLPSAIRLKSEIQTVMNTITIILKNPERSVRDKMWLGTAAELESVNELYAKEIAHYLKDTREFLAGIFGDTTILRYVTTRIPGKMKPQGSVWSDITNILKKIWAIIFNKDEKTHPTLFDSLMGIMEAAQTNLATYHHLRQQGTSEAKILQYLFERASNIQNPIERDVNDLYDILDADQVEENIERDTTFTDKVLSGSFVDLLAHLTKSKSRLVINAIKKIPSASSFITKVNDINAKSANLIERKLKGLYQTSYKDKIGSYEIFKERFLTFTFSYINKLDPKPHFRIVTHYKWNPGEQQQTITTSIVKDGKGSAKELKPRTVLDTLLPLFEKALGIDKLGTLEVHYVSGFDMYKDGKLQREGLNIGRLDNKTLGRSKDKTTPTVDLLSYKLWENTSDDFVYLFLGTFGGRDTLPVIAIPKQGNLVQKVERQLNLLKQQYIDTLQIANEEFDGVSDSMQRTNVARLLLTDLWYNAETVVREQDFPKLESTSLIDKDINKILKRGTLFLMGEEVVSSNIDLIRDKTKIQNYSGFKIEGDKVYVQGAIFNSEDVGNIDIITNEKKSISVANLLLNEYGIQTTDGAIFYIIGEFDDIYNVGHGIFKSGVLKNFYASRAEQDPLFLKHAMHGVHRDTPLGQFMIQNGIGLLISDSAAKIGGKPINISEHIDPSNPVSNVEGGILTLDMDNFQRYKEENNPSINAGISKQWWNGSGWVKSNPIISKSKKEEVIKILNDFTSRNTTRAFNETYSMTHPDELLDSFIDILNNPQGVYEERIAKTFSFLSEMDTNDIKARFGNLIALPHIAEVLRHRLIKPAKALFEGRISGVRATLRPNLGSGAPQSDINPITNKYNIAQLIMNLPFEHEMFREAFPEPGLGLAIRDFIVAQRDESKMHSKKTFDQKTDIAKRKKEALDKISAIADTVTDPNRQATLKNAPVYEMINKSEKLQNWIDQYIWGEHGILNPDTGRLNNGWIIISEDIANKYGLKAGDSIIAVVTPTDSILGVIPVRIAGIAPSNESANTIGRKVTDNMSVIFNSEFIQFWVGKDYDVDTISLLVNDPDIWEGNEFEALHQILEEAHKNYIDKAVDVTKKKLAEARITPVSEKTGKIIPITKDTVFLSEVKAAFCQAMLGKSEEGNKATFKAMGKDFSFITQAYLDSPAFVISERLLHTAMSAIDLKSKGVGSILDENKKYNFEANHDDWFATNLMHSHDTNHAVDFPNNTNRLTYNHTPEVFFKHLLGEEATQTEAIAIRDFLQWVFGPVFDLAANRVTETGAPLDYYNLKQQVLRQQKILKLLATNTRESRDALYNMYNAVLREKLARIGQSFGYEHKTYEENKKSLGIADQIVFNFIEKLKVSNIKDYPLFRMILELDVESLPIPGTSYEDHLIDQTLAAKDMIHDSPTLSEIFYSGILLDKDTSPQKRSFFTIPETAAQYEATTLLNILKPAYLLVRKELPKELQDMMASKSINHTERVATLLKDKESLAKIRIKIPDYLQEKFFTTSNEFIAIYNQIGEVYGPDFIQGEEEYEINNTTIALTLIPRQLDFIFNRNKGNMEDKITSVRDEVISIVHAFDESTWNPKETQPSATMTSNRWGRQVAYPKLMKKLLEKDQFTFAIDAKPTILNSKMGDIILYASKDNKLIVEHNGTAWYHTTLRANAAKDPDSISGKLYTALTEEDGVWKGYQAREIGIKNRQQLSSLLSLIKNISLSDRIELAEEHITDRLYSGKGKFNEFDLQGFWISFLGQVTNTGLKDHKAQNLVTNKTLFDKAKPLDFQSNHILYELMSQFEPGLLKNFLQNYSDNVRIRPRYNQAIGVRSLARTSDFNADHINQTRFSYPDEVFDPREHVGAFLKTFAPALEDIEIGSISYRRFKKLARRDVMAGLSLLKSKMRSIVVREALESIGLHGEELLRDIKNLGIKELQKKYIKYHPIEIEAAIHYAGTEPQRMEVLASEMLEVPSTWDLKNIAKMLRVFKAVRGIEKSYKRVEKSINPIFRKTIINVFNYEVFAPLREKKTYAFAHEWQKIADTFERDKVGELTVANVRNANNIYVDHAYRAFGLSSVAVAKNTILNTTIKTYQAELSERLDETERIIGLIASPQKAKAYIIDHINSRIPETVFLSDILKNISEKDDKFLFRKQVFDIAETMSKPVSRGGYGIAILKGDKGPIYRDLELNQVFPDKISLFNNRFRYVPAIKKAQLLAALSMREMFDYHVPRIIGNAIRYLQASYKTAISVSDYAGAMQIDALIQRYKQYLNAILEKDGIYMPHAFPNIEWRALWMSQYKEGITQALTREITFHNKLRADGKLNYNRYLASINLKTESGQSEFNTLLRKKLDNQFNEFQVGNPSSYVIKNFLPRKLKNAKDYIKTNPRVFVQYNNNLIEGLKNDLLMADSLVYEALARRHGERTALIDATKTYYGDQIQNKMLHTIKTPLKKIKKGMQVNFMVNSGYINYENVLLQVPLQAWGKVEDIDHDKRTITLAVDRYQLQFEIETDLVIARRNLSKLEETPSEAYEEITDKQINFIKALMSKEFLTYEEVADKIEKPDKRQSSAVAIRKLMQKPAAELIIKGLERALDNLGVYGTYSFDEIFTQRLDGGNDHNAINRYMRRGSIERLEGKARELHNIKSVDGQYGNIIEPIQYALFKVGGKVGRTGVGLLKGAFALGYMGMLVSSPAYWVNKLGAMLNNVIDSPIVHGKLWFKAKRTFKLKEEVMERLGDQEKKWNSLLTGLGIGTNRGIVDIAMQAGNLDALDVISEEGLFNNVRYLYRAFQESIGVKKYVKGLAKLKEEIVLEENENKRFDLIAKKLQMETEFKEKVEAKIAKKKILFPTKRGVRKVSSAFEEKLTPEMVGKMMLSSLGTKLMRGPFGIGLQALAEVERRPAFYIGYITALENGLTEQEAVYAGISRIGYTHAFYDAAHKQFGANTTLGKFSFQYAQYSNNSFAQQLKVFLQALPQTTEIWNSVYKTNKTPIVGEILQSLQRMKALSERTLIHLDGQRKAIKSGKSSVADVLKDANVIRHLSTKFVLGNIFMQLGSRLFYGVTNWQDPMIQLFYRLTEFITDASTNEFGDDDEERTALGWLILDSIFWLGIPYKIVSNFFTADPDEDSVTVLTRGRIQKQLDISYRLYNQFLKPTLDPEGMNSKDPLFLKDAKDLARVVDRYILGMSIFSWTPSEEQMDPYYSTKPRFESTSEFPFIGVTTERVRIDPTRMGRRIEGEKEGINFDARVRGLFDPKSWVPFLDLTDRKITPFWPINKEGED